MRFVSFALALVLLGCGDGDPPVLGGDGGRDASTDAGFDAEGFDASTDARRTDTAPPEECDEPGATEEVTCGACGTAIRFCTISGIWEYGPCGEETGICTPGDTDSATCGSCGMQM